MSRRRAAGNTVTGRRSTRRPAGLTLVIATDGVAARRLAVHGPTVMLGRASANDVVLADGSVSARHARIDLGPGGAAITDLASTNGTFVDGVRVEGSERLRDGCTVELGRVALAVEIDVADHPARQARAAADRDPDIEIDLRDTPAPRPGPADVDAAAGAAAAAAAGLAAGEPDVAGEVAGAAPLTARRARRRTVLVAHDPADADVAESIVAVLQQEGHLVWIDRSTEGDGWAGGLLDTVWSCDAVLFLVSSAAATSDRARREVHVAGAERTPVIPVLLDDAALPPDLAFYLAAANPVDLRTSVSAGMRSLTRRVAATPRKRVARPWLLARRVVLALVVAVAVLATLRYLF